jgi:hypothetical protein
MIVSHKDELNQLLSKIQESFRAKNYNNCYEYCRDYLFLCLDTDPHAENVFLTACRCIPHIELFFFLKKPLHQEFYDICSRFLDQYPQSLAHDEVAFIRLGVVEKSLDEYRARVVNDDYLVSLCDQFLHFYPQSLFRQRVLVYKKESIKRLFCHEAALALWNESNHAFLGAYFRWQEALKQLQRMQNPRGKDITLLTAYAHQHIQKNLCLLGIEKQ